MSEVYSDHIAVSSTADFAKYVTLAPKPPKPAPMMLQPGDILTDGDFLDALGRVCDASAEAERFADEVEEASDTPAGVLVELGVKLMTADRRVASARSNLERTIAHRVRDLSVTRSDASSMAV